MIVSQATLRIQDLIPAFLDALQEIDEELYAEALEELESWGWDTGRLFDCELYACPNYPDDDFIDWGIDRMTGYQVNFYTDEDAAYFLNDTLFELLNQAAPEGVYFSAHEGDGSLFGFWGAPCDEHIWPNENCEACQENVKRAMEVGS